MKYSKSARILNSIVYGVPLIVTTSIFVSSALATSQFSDEVAVETDTSQTMEIDEETDRSLSSAATLQSDEGRGIDRIRSNHATEYSQHQGSRYFWVRTDDKIRTGKISKRSQTD